MVFTSIYSAFSVIYWSQDVPRQQMATNIRLLLQEAGPGKGGWQTTNSRSCGFQRGLTGLDFYGFMDLIGQYEYDKYKYKYIYIYILYTYYIYIYYIYTDCIYQD